MRRILLGIGAGLLILSCGQPTTYGQAIQQKRSMVKSPADEQRRAPPSRIVEEARPACPALAAEGSADYANCERLLQEEEQGLGGSGPAEPEPELPPETDPNLRYWRDATDP